MRAHPVLLALAAWLLGSYFGLGQLLAFFSGMGRKAAPAPATA